MNWSQIYLFCFITGFVLSLLAAAGGSRLHLRWHGHVAHVGVHGLRGLLGRYLNLFAIAAFLAWFGAIGYLLETYGRLWLLFDLSFAVLGGFAGATLVGWVFTRLMAGGEQGLEAEDFELVGIPGRLSHPIRAGGGTGEMIFSQHGTRRALPARSEDGVALPKGQEVVITALRGGIALVRSWDRHLATSSNAGETAADSDSTVKEAQ